MKVSIISADSMLVREGDAGATVAASPADQDPSADPARPVHKHPIDRSMADPGVGVRAPARLLIISGDFPPTQSPEAAHAYHLANHFQRRGTQVTVLTTATGDGPPPPGVSVVRGMPRWSFRYLPRLAAILRRTRPEAILLIYLDTIYDHHPMVTFAPTIARRVLPGVPFVTQFENLMMAEETSLVTRAIRKVIRQWVTGRGTDFHYGTLLRDSRRVIVLSQRHEAGLLALDSTLKQRTVLIPPAPIMQMCPPGRDEERRRTRDSLGLAREDVAFCYYGYIYPGKGIETLLRAFATVNQSSPQARLLVIGSFAQHTFDREFAARSRSYEATVHDLAASLGLESRIRWLGHCPPTEPEGGRYLRAADACVMPFDRGVCLNNSSFSAVVAHGLATLTTVGPDTEEAIIKDGHVLACPPKDPAAMAEAMIRLIAEPDLRVRLSSGADDLTRAWFDWDTVVERIQATFVAA